MKLFKKILVLLHVYYKGANEMIFEILLNIYINQL